MFVTFEGCEGVGKSTQLNMLKEYLKKTGQDAVYVREPGSTAISEKIRSIILDPENTEMTAQTEALLYAAARAQLVAEVILPRPRQDGHLRQVCGQLRCISGLCARTGDGVCPFRQRFCPRKRRARRHRVHRPAPLRRVQKRAPRGQVGAGSGGFPRQGI